MSLCIRNVQLKIIYKRHFTTEQLELRLQNDNPAPRNLILLQANNKALIQTAHLRSLISAFVIFSLESTRPSLTSYRIQ